MKQVLLPGRLSRIKGVGRDKSIKAHKEQIKQLETYCGKAEKLHKDLKKVLEPIQKDIKKNKERVTSLLADFAVSEDKRNNDKSYF